MKVQFSIDLDSDKPLWELNQLLVFLRENKRLKEGSWRVSSSGKGGHIITEYEVPKYFEDMLDIESFKIGMRYALGDCLGRIKSDICRIAVNQEPDRLFYRKNGKNAGKWQHIRNRKP